MLRHATKETNAAQSGMEITNEKHKNLETFEIACPVLIKVHDVTIGFHIANAKNGI